MRELSHSRAPSNTHYAISVNIPLADNRPITLVRRNILPTASPTVGKDPPPKPPKRSVQRRETDNYGNLILSVLEHKDGAYRLEPAVPAGPAGLTHRAIATQLNNRCMANSVTHNRQRPRSGAPWLHIASAPARHAAATGREPRPAVLRDLATCG